MHANQFRLLLDRLIDERRWALAANLGSNEVYMADLDAELRATHAAYVEAAVTEIASLRAVLSGTLLG
jgi:hypothetical protein